MLFKVFKMSHIQFVYQDIIWENKNIEKLKIELIKCKKSKIYQIEIFIDKSPNYATLSALTLK